jgi:tripartite-type tricarboxylate transporter receptor subunit TctC
MALGSACGRSEGEGGGNEVAYPSRPIEIVSWATPGGPTDLLARALARVGSGYFDGQRLTVVTRQGGAGASTMQYLTGRAGDGHVLAVFTASGTVNMATGRIPFGPADFTPLLRIQLDPFLIAVRADSPHRDLTTFFQAAQARPGDLSVSGFGAASAHFLGFARLSAAAGDPDVRWIAYEGSADAVAAALGGHTDAVHTNYATVREHLRAGTMRVLGVSLPVAALAGTRTYAEQGLDVTPVHWRGVVGPPGLGPEIAADIRARLASTVQDPEFRQFMRDVAMEYAVMEDAEAFGGWMASEVQASRMLLETLGLLEPGPQ